MSSRAASLFASHAKQWADTPTSSISNRGHQTTVKSMVNDPDALVLASLENDVQRLHEINSLARKQHVKRNELLPRYQDYISNFIATGRKPNAIVVRNMIWAFDVLDLDYGMNLATYINRQGGASMPEGFRRDFYNYWYASIGDLAVAQMRNSAPITHHISVVYNDMIAHPERDIVDRIRAAVFSGQGACIESTQPSDAKILYELALELDPKCGVSRRLQRLKAVKPT